MPYPHLENLTDVGAARYPGLSLLGSLVAELVADARQSPPPELSELDRERLEAVERLVSTSLGAAWRAGKLAEHATPPTASGGTISEQRGAYELVSQLAPYPPEEKSFESWAQELLDFLSAVRTEGLGVCEERREFVEGGVLPFLWQLSRLGETARHQARKESMSLLSL
jgi:hypothetical protein